MTDLGLRPPQGAGAKDLFKALINLMSMFTNGRYGNTDFRIPFLKSDCYVFIDLPSTCCYEHFEERDLLHQLS